MSTVYIVQNQHRWDAAQEKFVPKFDLTTASKFGELSYLLSPTAAPFNSGPIIKELHEKLQWFGDDDHLLLIGNPTLIGCAMTIASKHNYGRVSVLQWSGTERKYIQIKLHMEVA